MNKFPTMLYIHSPYCKSICKYCGYRGRLKDDTYEKYFNEYLPNSIERYIPIIESQIISSIYFGGGTPNYDSFLNLKPTFEKIRGIKFKEKVIEIHSNLEITDEMIDLLAYEGFTSVILCIQTFDKEYLDSQNRIHPYDNDLSVIIGKFHNKGIKVGSDLIFFPDRGLDAFEKDFETLAIMENRVDEISVAPLYQSMDKGEIHLPFLKNRLMVLCGKYGYHSPIDLRKCGCEGNNEVGKCLRVFSSKENLNDFLNEDFFSFIYHIDEGSVGFPHPYSCIGIGSYNNPDKMTYSFLNEQYVIGENWDGNEVHYYMLKERSFYDKCRDIIAWMEKTSVLPPPSGLHLDFTNDEGHSNYNTNDYERLPKFSFWTEDFSDYVEYLKSRPELYENGSIKLLGMSDER